MWCLYQRLMDVSACLRLDGAVLTPSALLVVVVLLLLLLLLLLLYHSPSSLRCTMSIVKTERQTPK